MADASSVTLSPEHAPHPNAVDAFKQVNRKIKAELIRLRHDWNKHEERMFARVVSLSDEDLVDWKIEDDLVAVRSGPVAYGVLLFGKVRIPRAKDGAGEAFIHVRLHDPPTGEGKKDIELHSIWTRVIKDGDGVMDYEAIQTDNIPLDFFNE